MRISLSVAALILANLTFLVLGIAIVVAFTVAMLPPGLANTTGFVILLILLKLSRDYVLHKRERNAFTPTQP